MKSFNSFFGFGKRHDTVPEDEQQGDMVPRNTEIVDPTTLNIEDALINSIDNPPETTAPEISETKQAEVDLAQALTEEAEDDLGFIEKVSHTETLEETAEIPPVSQAQSGGAKNHPTGRPFDTQSPYVKRRTKMAGKDSLLGRKIDLRRGSARDLKDSQSAIG